MGTKVQRPLVPPTSIQSWPLGGQCGDGLQSEPPSLEVSFMGEPLGQSNLKVVGPADLHMDILAPLLHSVVCYGLGMSH